MVVLYISNHKNRESKQAKISVGNFCPKIAARIIFAKGPKPISTQSCESQTLYNLFDSSLLHKSKRPCNASISLMEAIISQTMSNFTFCAFGRNLFECKALGSDVSNTVHLTSSSHTLALIGSKN